MRMIGPFPSRPSQNSGQVAPLVEKKILPRRYRRVGKKLASLSCRLATPQEMEWSLAREAYRTFAPCSETLRVSFAFPKRLSQAHQERGSCRSPAPLCLPVILQ